MDERRHILVNKVLSYLTGVGVAVLAWFVGNNCEFPPELWGELSVVSKLRPPEREFPVIWRAVMSWVVGNFGIDFCVGMLKMLGPVSLGLLTAMTARLFFGYLPRVMKSDMLRTAWGRWIVRVVVLQCVLFFALSEPVWLAGRVFSPDMFALLQLLLALLLALWALERSSVICMVLLGALSALSASERAISAAITPAFALYLVLKDGEMDVKNPSLLTNRVVQSVAFRWMGWTFVLCCIVFMSANFFFFRTTGGAEIFESGFFWGMVRYLTNIIRYFVSIATPSGWTLIVAVALIPMVIAVGRVRPFADSDRLPSVLGGCLLTGMGLVAFSQCTGLDELHFWRWSEGSVRSPFMLCLCMFATSLTTMFVLCIFVVDIYFRNHGRILRAMFPVDLEDDYLAEKAIHVHRVSVRILRPLMLAEPVVALALVIPFKFDSTVRDMSAVVNDVVAQTAEECGDSTMLFSDGSLDAAVEVAVARRGGHLKALSMMSGSGKYDVALRTRGEKDEEVRTLLSIGAADALRTWVTEENSCVSNIALQVGLELWRRNNFPIPKAGGLVSRTAGFPEGDAEKYAKRAHSLAERILKFYAGGKPIEVGCPELNRMFLFSQWRLSRMCRMRANEADGRKDSKTSEFENSLADRLDRRNPEWQRVQDRMDWIGKQGGMRLTPREGLKLGLERADFRLAKSYARKVIISDADDPFANFALGMSYFTEKEYGRAEMHLKKCLIRAPTEPAVLNNLAIIQLRLGRYLEAEANVLKALERFPDSSEIKTTLRHIRAAMKDGNL